MELRRQQVHRLEECGAAADGQDLPAVGGHSPGRACLLRLLLLLLLHSLISALRCSLCSPSSHFSSPLSSLSSLLLLSPLYSLVSALSSLLSSLSSLLSLLSSLMSHLSSLIFHLFTPVSSLLSPVSSLLGIYCVMNPRCLRYMASCHVTRSIIQAVMNGRVHRQPIQRHARHRRIAGRGQRAQCPATGRACQMLLATSLPLHPSFPPPP